MEPATRRAIATALLFSATGGALAAGREALDEVGPVAATLAGLVLARAALATHRLGREQRRLSVVHARSPSTYIDALRAATWCLLSLSVASLTAPWMPRFGVAIGFGVVGALAAAVPLAGSLLRRRLPGHRRRVACWRLALHDAAREEGIDIDSLARTARRLGEQDIRSVVARCQQRLSLEDGALIPRALSQADLMRELFAYRVRSYWARRRLPGEAPRRAGNGHTRTWAPSKRGRHDAGPDTAPA